MNTPTYVAEGELGEYGFKIEQSGANYTITAATFADMSVQYKFSVGGTDKGTSYNNICNGILSVPDYDFGVQVQFIVSEFGADGTYYISSNPSVLQNISYSN